MPSTLTTYAFRLVASDSRHSVRAGNRRKPFPALPGDPLNPSRHALFFPPLFFFFFSFPPFPFFAPSLPSLLFSPLDVSFLEPLPPSVPPPSFAYPPSSPVLPPHRPPRPLPSPFGLTHSLLSPAPHLFLLPPPAPPFSASFPLSSTLPPFSSFHPPESSFVSPPPSPPSPAHFLSFSLLLAYPSFLVAFSFLRFPFFPPFSPFFFSRVSAPLPFPPPVFPSPPSSLLLLPGVSAFSPLFVPPPFLSFDSLLPAPASCLSLPLFFFRLSSPTSFPPLPFLVLLPVGASPYDFFFPRLVPPYFVTSLCLVFLVSPFFLLFSFFLFTFWGIFVRIARLVSPSAWYVEVGG